MAKKAKTKAKKVKKAKLVITATHLKHANAIVAEVISHFGAGYATERSKEGTAMVLNDPIFGTHADFLVFQKLLVRATSRNLAKGRFKMRHWSNPALSAMRAQVTLTAFKHASHENAGDSQGRLPNRPRGRRHLRLSCAESKPS
jgi:hypothetical protein